MSKEFFYNPWIWFLVTGFTLYLCTMLPIRIKDDRKRQRAYWFILMPVSLVIICYVYPVGIELCKRLALHW